MRIAFAGSRHPVFTGTSPLSRGMLKTKGGGKTSIHCDAEPQTAELSCRQSAQYFWSSCGLVPRFYLLSEKVMLQKHVGRLVANVSDDEAPKVPSELVSRLTKNSIWNSEVRGDLAQQRDANFKHIPEDVNLAQIGDDARSSRSVSVGQFFVTHSALMLKGHGVTSSCRGVQVPSK